MLRKPASREACPTGFGFGALRDFHFSIRKSLINKMRTIVISPFSVINFPEGGGHFWVYMQYVQCLRRIGCDVYWLEAYRSEGNAEADRIRLAAFFERMEAFGLRQKLILYPMRNPNQPSGMPKEYAGMQRSDAEAIFERADLLMNFHYAIAPELLARFGRTALMDIDPGLLQFWISRGQLSVPRHDLHFTTGETVGSASSRIPDCGLKWIYFRPAISLEDWPVTFDADVEAFTTISNWDSDDWIVDANETYENTKRAAFLEFLDLPRVTDQPLELALFLRTEKDFEDRRELERRGWRVRHSRDAAGSPENYQSYIRQSRGEFSCAKRSYLKFQNAWVSDRTLCYLASGKPVVVQNTGPSSILPSGEGMFRFSTVKEAAKAFAAINRDYSRHSRAARQLAEVFFDGLRSVRGILNEAIQ